VKARSIKAAFELRFPLREIEKWFSKYNPLGDIEMINKLAPRIQERRHLTKDEFLTLCRWKSPRSQSRCAANSEDYIREITHIALTTNHERLRFEVLHLLQGVSSPTASVILHFGFDDCYPILDYRALWSLGVEKPPPYNFDYWWQYVSECRKLSRQAGVTMRVLDRALWQYSKLHQSPK
jgi:hypothetical protein